MAQGCEPDPLLPQHSADPSPTERPMPVHHPRNETDLIAEIIADLEEDCHYRFSGSNSYQRSRGSSASSSASHPGNLNRIHNRQRSFSAMASDNLTVLNDADMRGRTRTRSINEEAKDQVPEMLDSSYHTSRRSSTSRLSMSKNPTGITDSAVSLAPEKKKRQSNLREAHSSEDEPKRTGSAESNHDENEQATAPPYPSPAKTALIMVSLYISIFLVALDRTIMGPAIAAITNEFNSIDDIGWYGSAYMLTSAGFILLYGRIYTFFPTKPVFLSGIFMFEAGSAICGAAQSSIMLIVGRAIAGLGSSSIFTGAILIMLNTVPLHKRPMLQGLFGACFGVASVAGPLLGGAFTGSKLTWRWCFYINLPLGGLTILVVCFLLKLEESKPKLPDWKETIKHLDPLGAILFLPCITCLLLALEWGAAEFPWSSPRIVALLTIFAVLFVAFIAWQYYTRNTTATVPARIIFQQSVAFGGASQFCVGSTMLTVSIYIPLWFQAIKGVSAMQSGINTIPLVLSVVVGSILSGGLVQRIGYYTPFMILGSALMAAGTGLLTTWDMDTSRSMWIGYQVMLGFGVGCTMQHPNIAVQTVLPKHDVPIGTAILSLCQTLGGSVFTAVGQNLYIDKFTGGLGRIPGVNLAHILHAGATDLTNAVPPVLRGRVLEAYNHALTKGTFFAALIVACLAVPAALGMEWRSVKEKPSLSKSSPGRDEEKQDSIVSPPPANSDVDQAQHQTEQCDTQEPAIPPPKPAWKKMYRASGQFSSYLTAKINPDLRDELNGGSPQTD